MTDSTAYPTRRAFLGALSSPLLVQAAQPMPVAPVAFKEDALLLARAYQALHPGLYRYNTPAEMAARFAELHSFLSEPRTLGQAYVALARVTAAVRCGHSHPNFYNQSKTTRTALFEGRDRLPLYFRWIEDRMVVTRFLAPDVRLTPGAEIQAINDLPVPSLLSTLLPLARADGSNDGKRRRQMDVSGADRWEPFDLYVPMLFPQLMARGEVTLSVRELDGRQRRLTVALMTAAERIAAAQPPTGQPRDVPWSLTRQSDGIQVLRMPTWSVYNSGWDWRAWLEAALDSVSAEGARALIVDLRGNEGGLDCGQPILARLIDKNVEVSRPRSRVRYRKLPADLAPHVDTWDDSFRDWGAYATGPTTDGFYDLTRWGAGDREVIRPAGRRFNGELVVLIDAANSSATFQFAEMVKDTGLGRLVGTTTGGNRRGINGGAFLFLRLPASGIEVDIPLIGYFPEAPQPDAGVVPDLVVADSIADVTGATDRTIAAAVQMLG